VAEDEEPRDAMTPTLSVEADAAEDTPPPAAQEIPPPREEPEVPADPEPPRQVFELTLPEPAPEPKAKEPEKDPEQGPDLKAARPESPSQKPAPETPKKEGPKVYSGGYLSRPTHIYEEPAGQHSGEGPENGEEKKESQISLVFREEKKETPDKKETPQEKQEPARPVQPPRAPVPEVTLEETGEQKRIAAERIARLRNISFNVRNAESHEELETVPAYIRRDVPLDHSRSSADEPYSGYSVRKPAEGKGAEISTINTFLQGKKPD
jgi:cell division protein FtsZ